MKIIIETIPHDQQRYNTCGDWKWTAVDELTIKISAFPGGMKSSKYLYETLVAVHELVEAISCDARGIGEHQVDAFDNDEHWIDEADQLEIEIGDHPEAPYKEQHCFATGIERMLCAYFKIDWFEYEKELIKMTETYRK
jgi:hypothetical protein